ncbi:MAG: hypothetical protein DRJ50_09370, partial [Actinobacteria bacterium]
MLTTSLVSALPAGAADGDGSISGTVTDMVSGDPIPDVEVTAYEVGSNWLMGSTTTGPDGTYVLGGLVTISGAVVEFAPSAGFHRSEWYDDASNSWSATTVPIVPDGNVPGIDAELELGGSISGTVVEEDGGQPIEGVAVDVKSLSYQSLGSAITDASGDYTVFGLPAGDARVGFADLPRHVNEWYDDHLNLGAATPVTVTAGADTPGIDASLVVPSSLSGLIKETGTDAPLEGIRVDVYDHFRTWLGATNTGADGTYAVEGLPPVTVRVEFIDNIGGHTSEWYDDQSDFFVATPISLIAGQLSPDINADLERGGSISGVVTEEATGTGANGIQVVVTNLSNLQLGSTVTALDGTYSVAGIPAGWVKVQFYDPSEMLIREWYNDQTTFETATSVQILSAAETVGIDAELAGNFPGPLSLTGTITDQDGAPIPTDGTLVGADVYDLSGNRLGSGYADPAGFYTVTALSAGSVKVEFWGPDAYFPEWYDNQPDFDSATQVEVVPGIGASGVDASLARGGSVSGTVTEEGSTNPVGDLPVDLYDLSWNLKASGKTDPSGDYTVVGLSTGSYKIMFGQYGPYPFEQPQGGHIAEWYNDQPDFTSATPVSVTVGSAVVNIDAVLAVGASVSGVVSNQGAGAPVPAEVYVYDTSGTLLRSGMANASGEYRVSGLPSGMARVEFRDGAGLFVGEWYNDQLSFASSTPVALTTGVDTPNIDAQLATAAVVSGRVTDEDGGDPIGGVDVYVYSSSMVLLGSTVSDDTGAYRVLGLRAGPAIVEFRDLTGGYAAEWYDNAQSPDSAADVPLTAGFEETNIDAALVVAGSIAGTVTNIATGVGIEDIAVDAMDRLTGEALGSELTDGSGAYRIDGLFPGEYVLFYSSVSGPTGPYVEGWYEGKDSFETATPVVVVSGSVPTVADIPVEVGSWITGIVTVDGTGAPLDNICVWAADTDTGAWAEEFGQTFSGEFEFGLIPGSYRLNFVDCASTPTHVSEWWDDQATYPSGTPVVVPADGSALGPFDAALLPNAGSISGTVTATGGGVFPGDACTSARDASGGYYGGVTAEPDGTYTITGLPYGPEIFVRFDDCGIGAVPQTWWDGKETIDEADPIVLATNEHRTGIDGVLGTPADEPVTNDVAPSVSGVTKVGKSLTGNAGSWSGTEPISYAYQWLRCDAGGSSCADVSGATG